MPIDIAFETHSISEDNEPGIATGWLPGRLSARGRALARELGERHRSDGTAAVFSSDLARAVETVEIAFAGQALPIHTDPRLRECDYGELSGASVELLAFVGDLAPFDWQPGWRYRTTRSPTGCPSGSGSPSGRRPSRRPGCW